MCVTMIAIAKTPMASHASLGQDKRLVIVSLVLYHIGIIMMIILASLLMARLGRRAGFSIGAVISIISGIISTVSIFEQNFYGLYAGTLLMGGSAGCA